MVEVLPIDPSYCCCHHLYDHSGSRSGGGGCGGKDDCVAYAYRIYRI